MVNQGEHVMGTLKGGDVCIGGFSNDTVRLLLCGAKAQVFLTPSQAKRLAELLIAFAG